MDKQVPPGLDKVTAFTETALVFLDALQSLVLPPATPVIMIVNPGRPDHGMMIGVPEVADVRPLLDHIEAENNDIGPAVQSEMERRKFRRNRRG